MVVYFELILAKKLHHGRIIWESRRDGFLCYRCSRSKLLECFGKHPWWCAFLILANKALYHDSFLVIFQIFQNSYFKQHLRTAASERCFVLRKQSPENVKKAALKNLRKLSRQRP